ncbi:hypothetical protein HORIV_50320 [Vreelandella olivaria]|uniref:Uncharacterized protein n=1 Tax=Vreelandella olivaria TaxID=390919 RepID=A0ABM7GPG5_9GAMM|nr:hypothetical protein HORIV_50320 [Halomonas olivaria]
MAVVTLSLMALAGGLLVSLPLAIGEVPLPWLMLLGAFGFLPIVEVATLIVNRLIIYAIDAQPLPSLDLAKGVSPQLRTLVAVPTLLTSEEDLREQIERLEVHHLSSGEGALGYALLLDGVDASQAQLPHEAALLTVAQAAVEQLNKRYCPLALDSDKRFFLLHRQRVFNASESTWMGWERKRGKLHELNRLLRGAMDTTFIDPPPLPSGVRYVITLDADTRLPRGAASQLIGKMAHPLNQPRLDQQLRRVVEGYAILQPRVTPSLPTGAKVPSTSGSSPRQGELTLTPLRLQIFIRIWSAKARSPVKVFTRSMPLKPRWLAGCPKTACSATICSKVCSPERGSPPISK